MGRVWEAWGPVLVAWGIGVTAIPLIVALLLWWRARAGIERPIALLRSLTEVGIVAGTLPWVWMILTPTGGTRTVSVVPLRDLAATLRELSFDTVVQIGANTAMFVPLGFLLPLRFPRFAGTWRMLVVGAALSATLELAQYVLNIGRVSSVDDVLMNAVGAAIGAHLLTMGRKSWSARSLVPPPHRLDPADHPLPEAGVVAGDRDVASRFWHAP
ncbi:VanZ family protein [Nocardia sp. JW2]|uniref:VanZ family protein n=1 Tax=Nocardia sp. JW2 TaxID=3450738 RepID=UPI003F43F2C9